MTDSIYSTPQRTRETLGALLLVIIFCVYIIHIIYVLLKVTGCKKKITTKTRAVDYVQNRTNIVVIKYR